MSDNYSPDFFNCSTLESKKIQGRTGSEILKLNHPRTTEATRTRYMFFLSSYNSNHSYCDKEMEDVWALLQREFSNAMWNWEGRRPYTASLAVRTLGFTEEWGASDETRENEGDDDDDGGEPGLREFLREQPPPDADNTTIIRLVQFRPAWLEQLVLRVAGIRHRVINSPYAVTEATGPLPFLQGCSSDATATTSTTSNKIMSHSSAKTGIPVLVGRSQGLHSIGFDQSINFDESDDKSPKSGNAILDYLYHFREVDLDGSLSRLQIQESILYSSLILNTLQPSLAILRYQADPHAWQQTYKPQCIRAGVCNRFPLNSGHFSWMECFSSPWLFAAWQAGQERAHALSSIPRLQRAQSIQTTIAKVRKVYQLLEDRLQASTYICQASTQPCLADCLLWDHLMQALSDIHLVIVLAEFPALLRFTQLIWSKYLFDVGVDVDSSIGGTDAMSLSVWNLEENVSNAFNLLPQLPRRYQHPDGDKKNSLDCTLDMMEKLSIFRRDLQQTLMSAKNRRQSEKNGRCHSKIELDTWHRWRMGDGYFPRRQTTDRECSTTAADELIRREYRRNDEIWLASIFAATLGVFLCFGMNAGK